jgi:hypothetical protein
MRMEEQIKLIEKLDVDLSKVPLNFMSIKEDKKVLTKSIEVEAYGTLNYFGLTNFYKPISNF